MEIPDPESWDGFAMESSGAWSLEPGEAAEA